MVNKKNSVSYISDFKGVMLLRDEVYNAMKGEIITGHLKPGETININEIAKGMNISTAPVREALNMLDKDGLVELYPHKKAVVARRRRKDFYAAVEIRKRLEPFAARLSIDLIPEEKIDETLEKLYYVLENSDELMKYLASDMEFHELLHIHYGSKVLSDTLSSLKNLQYCYGIERTNESEEEKIKVREEFSREHIEIAKALKERDADKVEALIMRHLENYEILEKKYFKED